MRKTGKNYYFYSMDKDGVTYIVLDYYKVFKKYLVIEMYSDGSTEIVLWNRKFLSQDRRVK